MKLNAHPAKRFLVAVAAVSFFLSSSVCAQNIKSAERPLNLLVLGDSILWGQGLKEEHKAWHQVKSWLEQTTGREVREKIEAHSGAVIRSEEHTSELQSQSNLVCRLLLEKKNLTSAQHVHLSPR